MLGVHLVEDLKQQLFHHQKRRFCKVNSVIKVHSLCLLRLPNFLWDQFAQSSVNLDIGKFQFLVNLVKVLPVYDDKDVAFWELSVFEVVTEAFIAGSYWTRRPLLV